MPSWLLELCLPAQPVVTPRPEVPANLGAWARAALDAEVTAVRNSVEGVRNHTLNRAAFALGQLVGGGHLDEADVVDHLTRAATAAGLSEREAAPTITSGLRAGTTVPRHRGGVVVTRRSTRPARSTVRLQWHGHLRRRQGSLRASASSGSRSAFGRPLTPTAAVPAGFHAS